MYQQHFQFTAPPFSIAPNPRYVYLSRQHREALAHLLYGISVGGGFVALTGEVGTGKTTLCRCLLEQLPEDVDIALIFNPRLNARELLATICDELHIAHPGDKTSIKRLIDLLNHHLLDSHARGRRTIVLIDEAQNLSFDVLEQVRLLTNLETNETKLLQIILVGQPELRTLLAKPGLRQLSQRINARFHLLPLSWAETNAYIRHRLAVSGVSRRIFSRLASARIFLLSGGIPRLINLICDRALLGAYTLGKTRVNVAIVGKAAAEVLPGRTRRPLTRVIAALAALAFVLLTASLYKDSRFVPPALSSWLGRVQNDLASVRLTQKAVPSVQDESSSPSVVQPKAVIALQEDVRAVEAQQQPPPKENKPAVESTDADPARGDVGRTRAEPPAVEAPPAAAASGDGNKMESATEPQFEDLIARSPATRSAAFARLFSLWGIEVPPGEFDECRLARDNGLRCLDARGDRGLLPRLGHPALMEFVLPDGSRRYATLAGIAGGKWILDLDTRAVVVEPERLTPRWQGNFVLLWKPTRATEGIIKTGKSGEVVRWIRQILNEPARTGRETYFDPRLKERIMDFQQKNDLPADGEVGPMTLIQLEKLSGQSEGPRLIKPRD